MIRQIQVGDVPVGGGAPVSIQSMLNTKTTDVEGSLRQLEALKAAGCQIARLAVPNEEAARGFREIAAQSPLPLVADIHFDYKLAIAAAEGGAAKIRINPGNIGGEDRVQAVVEVCKSKHIPIRIGVNGGSLDKKLLEKYGHPTAEALVESAFSHLELLEKQGFYDTCVSMKSYTVPPVPAAVRLSSAHWRDGNRSCSYGDDQIGDGHWGPPAGWHRGDGPGLSHRRPGAGGLRRQGDPSGRGFAEGRRKHHFLPHLWQDLHRPHWPGGAGGPGASGL